MTYLYDFHDNKNRSAKRSGTVFVYVKSIIVNGIICAVPGRTAPECRDPHGSQLPRPHS